MRAIDVRKVYGDAKTAVTALRGVSLEVMAGEMVAVVGPSGCGKSTLLNLIGCTDLPTSGTMVVDGQSTSTLDDDALTRLRRDRVGTIFQFFNLLGSMTVRENVALPLVLQRKSSAEIAQRVTESLTTVGLAGRAAAYPAELSGGEAQRTAIARAIVHRPAIVLADEPTGNLDTQNGATVLDLLRGLARGGRTILMVTHSVEAAAACDRVIAMRDGLIA